MSEPVLSTSLDIGSPGAQERAANNRALGGDERSREPHVSRDKRFRAIELSGCLTRVSPILEIGRLSANGLYGDNVPGAGSIAGIGLAGLIQSWSMTVHRFIRHGAR